MNEYRQGLDEALMPLARMFCVTFSRFEFALKRGDFLKGEIGSAAHADWDKFANALGPAFLKRMNAAPEADIFFSARPKKLMVIAKDDVDFQEPPAIVSVQQLFEAIRLIRNNLFHGEKTYITQRDNDLITAALFVLDNAFSAAMNDPECQKMTLAFVYAAINPH
jgi:hypothetical protein